MFHSKPSQVAEILSNQFRILGIDVVNITPADFQAEPGLQPGDVLVADTSRAEIFPPETIQSITEKFPTVPVIILHTGELAEPSDAATFLNKPVSRQALVDAIFKLDNPIGPRLELIPELPAAHPPDRLRKMRILAAEDNRTNRLVFSKLVGKLNVDLEFAENGQQAVEKWQSFRPDMIFMDISMPIMDGKEATQKIREIEAKTDGAHIPIIALTAHAMDGDGQEILDAGLDYYLTKPLRKVAIFEQIRTAVPDFAEPVFEDNLPETAAQVVRNQDTS